MQDSDFVFIKASHDVYLIDKDRYNFLFPFVAVDEVIVKDFMNTKFKVKVKNTEGEVIMKNFNEPNMKVVQDLLTDAELEYNNRLQLMADIDKALDEGNKELFMELTSKLNGGLENECGVA
jgi:hypothetical protein